MELGRDSLFDLRTTNENPLSLIRRGLFKTARSVETHQSLERACREITSPCSQALPRPYALQMRRELLPSQGQALSRNQASALARPRPRRIPLAKHSGHDAPPQGPNEFYPALLARI